MKTNKASKDGYLQTYGGNKIYIQADKFDVNQVTFEDVAHALPHINRYAGHTKYAYSVAQHCIALSSSFHRQAMLHFKDRERHDELLMYSRWAFIHDWAEYATNDIPLPFKNRMPELLELDDRLTAAIAVRYNLPSEMPEEVHNLDRRMCRNEMDVFGSPNVPRWWDAMEPVPYINPWDLRRTTPEDIRSSFYQHAHLLGMITYDVMFKGIAA